MSNVFVVSMDNARDEELDAERPSTPYHIIEILLNNRGTILPGVSRVEMRRRRSMSSLEMPSPKFSVELPITQSLFGSQSPNGNFVVNGIPRLNRQSTLALLTVDEDESRILARNKRKHSDVIEAPPPSYQQVTKEIQFGPRSVRNLIQASRRLDRAEAGPNRDECCCWPWFLQNRPILRLFLVIVFNGIVSMVCAAVIMELERPAQLQRFKATAKLQTDVDLLKKNLTSLLRSSRNDPSEVMATFRKYTTQLDNLTSIEDEIPWDMLAGAAYVNSVASTTGYGDIVAVTPEGKLFTLAYALYGIPIFIWYIVKLGALFRVVVMRLIYQLADSFRHQCSSLGRDRMRQHLKNVFVTVSRPVQLEPHSITEDLQDDKRFHPSIIGVILLVFMASVAAFISYMEDIAYFNSLYACFITYSTIGFGDIDIYRISYRSNWFNLMIYGNCVHIAGYVILSAWVSSILDKCGIRKQKMTL